jgi:hypothetical protein
MKKEDIRDLLKCYYPLHENIVEMIALKTPVLEEFSKLLSYLDKETLPLLLPYNKFGETPFDVAVSTNNTKSIKMLIEMMVKYQENTLLNYIFD